MVVRYLSSQITSVSRTNALHNHFTGSWERIMSGFVVKKKKKPYKAFVICHFLCHFLCNPIWRICFCLGRSAWLRATQQKLFFSQWFTFLVSAGFGLGPSSSSVLKDFSTLTSLEGCSKEWNSVVCSFAFFRNESSGSLSETSTGPAALRAEEVVVEVCF